MSLYIIVGAILLVGAIYEVLNRKTSNFLYFVFFLGLVLMLCFRYGQGTDYFAYQYIYEFLPETLNISELRATDNSLHSEIGWKIINAIFKMLGFDFYTFAGIIGTITMLLLNNFIQKFCPLKVTALLIAYPTLYLTYVSSGLRQALVLCLFLGVMLDWYLKNKKKRYIIFVLLCVTIHTASWVLLLLMLPWLKEFLVRNRHVAIFVCWAIGVILLFTNFNVVILGRTFANARDTVSYVAVAERLLTYIVVQFFYDKHKAVNEENELLTLLMLVYSMGLMIYGICLSMPLVASRTCYFFKALEIALCTVMIANKKNKFSDFSILFVYMAAVSVVMLFKNIDSYISQGLYYSTVTVWNYPYNNIFEKGNYRFSIHQYFLN